MPPQNLTKTTRFRPSIMVNIFWFFYINQAFALMSAAYADLKVPKTAKIATLGLVGATARRKGWSEMACGHTEEISKHM